MNKSIKDNKLTHGVFIKIVGDINHSPAYDQFIEKKGEIQSIMLKGRINKYINSLNEIKPHLEILSMMEELIIQQGCLENLNINEIKLILVQNKYIYAKAPFFSRNKKNNKDIRVIVGQVNTYGKDMKILLKNKDFMINAKDILKKKMLNELSHRDLILKQILKNK